MTKQLSPSDIRIDGGTQLRVEIDYHTVDDYAAAYQSGAKMPPLVVFHDGATYWLADGFHRWHASKKAGLEKVACDVQQGSQREAILYAAGANDTNGLRRKIADKRCAVMKLLHDPEWSKRSDKWIAETARVSRPMVAEWRSQCKSVSGCSSASCGNDEPRKVEGKDGKTYTVKKSKPKKQDLHVPPIDEEVEAPVLQVTPRPPLRTPKSFDEERNLVRALADLVTHIKKTHYESSFDKGRLTHELNEWANEIAEAIEEAEAVA